jgi:hypothetical protein
MTQLSIDFQACVDEAIKRVADNTEKRVPGWVDLAVAKLGEYARTAGNFTIDTARASIATTIPTPHDLRAWGHVTRRARRQGLIVQVGMEQAASSHGSLKPLYRGGVQ